MSFWRKNAQACNLSGNAMSLSGKPDVRFSVVIVGMCLIGFMSNSNPVLNLTPCIHFSPLKSGQPKCANIELLLNNPKIRDVIDTIAKKAVLILGRFTPERKAVLDDLREALRIHGYLPILFDFEKPS